MKCQCVRILQGGYQKKECPHDAKWTVEALPVIEKTYVCQYHVGKYRKLKRHPHGFPNMVIDQYEEL